MKDILKEYITRAVFCIIPKKVQELSGCLFVFHIYDGNPCFPRSPRIWGPVLHFGTCSPLRLWRRNIVNLEFRRPVLDAGREDVISDVHSDDVGRGFLGNIHSWSSWSIGFGIIQLCDCSSAMAVSFHGKGLYTWNLFVHYFGGLSLQNKAFPNQNKGHLGSRYKSTTWHGKMQLLMQWLARSTSPRWKKISIWLQPEHGGRVLSALGFLGIFSCKKNL